MTPSLMLKKVPYRSRPKTTLPDSSPTDCCQALSPPRSLLETWSSSSCCTPSNQCRPWSLAVPPSLLSAFRPRYAGHKTPWSLHDGALTRLTSSGFYSDPPTTTSSILISASGGDILQSTTNGKEMDIRVLMDDSGVHLVYRMISWVKLRKYREMVRRVRRGSMLSFRDFISIHPYARP